jgi:hypothetical protein
MAVDRISVEDTRRRVEAGQALLVCAYADEGRCRQLRLDGAVTLAELEARLPSIPRDRELIFYCA